MPLAPTVGYTPMYPTRAATADPQTGLGVQFAAGVSARDGTPSRVAGALLLSGAALAVLKMLGFRFNVGVSS